MTERQLKSIIKEEINNVLKENKTWYSTTEYLKNNIIKIGKIGQYLSTQKLPTIYKQSFTSEDIDLTIKSLNDFKFLFDSHVNQCYEMLNDLIEEIEELKND